MNLTVSESKQHLLVVDDDALLRSMTVMTLRHAGFEVSEAENGEQALTLFDERHCDMILLDVLMPGLNGYQVCQRIRRTPQGGQLPILVLTGLNDTDSIEMAYHHGATDFITKPINWTLLSHRVRYALRASADAESMRRSHESLVRAQRIADMGNWLEYTDGRVICSTALLHLLGTVSESMVCESAEAFLAYVIPNDRERVSKARTLLWSTGKSYHLEFTIERTDGELRSVFEQATPFMDERGRQAGIEGIIQDITERVQARKRIQHLAHYDPITSLPNRQYFVKISAPFLQAARYHGTLCAVMHVDIDRFKRINDTLGLTGGDFVLGTISERMQTWARGAEQSSAQVLPGKERLIAHLGGNVFLLLITDLGSLEQASVIAQQVQSVLAQPVDAVSPHIILTASLGISIFPHDGIEITKLASCAEQAAYAAKGAGRSQHRFFNEEMNKAAVSRSKMESELRSAITEGQLELHYQPKVDASSSHVFGVEALVRWQHPEYGQLAPSVFIPLAEETGLIDPLTDWVLDSSCRFLRDLRNAGHTNISVSVNLPAVSFLNHDIVEKLNVLMRLYSLLPNKLVLEVTETMLIEDIEKSISVLESLKKLNYGLSLDDFGTGYSSLSYLKRFSVDELKIDRSFVMDAISGHKGSAIVAAIIALGREYGLRVIAEGVETTDQSNFLMKNACSLQQGYLFSRPLNENQLLDFLVEMR